MKLIQYYFLFWLMLLSLLGSAQEISNIHFEQVGKQIHIYYDLDGDGAYTVQVYCSTDDGKSWGKPLRYVTGDVGEKQKPGKGKMIVWDVLKEKEKLTGNVKFKIEALPGNAGLFTDGRDDQTYKWLKIGGQVWMAENLNYKTEDSWCYYYKATNCNKYGRLYNWRTARTACPAGWHLPSDSEWDILVDYLGASSVAGGKMKEAGTTHWGSANSGATNSSGFTALPGGYRTTDGYFPNLGNNGTWWSATEYNSNHAWYRHLHYNNDKVSRIGTNKGYGFSVRCLRD